MYIRLYEIAYARSGDKGSDANVGVIAYTPEGYDFLHKVLTAEHLSKFLAPTGLQCAIRYELPNLLAFNFVLKGALGLGGSQSLRIDAQGKALGQITLELLLDIPEAQLQKCMRPKAIP